MISLDREYEIKNSYGIHARPAALFVKTAGKFLSDIKVKKDDVEVSGKSIMGLLTLECHQGCKIIISAAGEDAEDALAALGELLENKFNEEE